LPLQGDWQLQQVIDSDDWAHSRAYAAPPRIDEGIMSGEWLAAHGLNLVTLLPHQALLIEGVRV
ncbi:MAG: hypothetical protein ACPGUF_08120, partial [Litorivicinus sp.]